MGILGYSGSGVSLAYTLERGQSGQINQIAPSGPCGRRFLYTALCDAVAPEQDQTTGADFCERCQPAFLRVDEERNAELVAREELWFRLGLEVGRRIGGAR